MSAERSVTYVLGSHNRYAGSQTNIEHLNALIQSHQSIENTAGRLLIATLHAAIQTAVNVVSVTDRLSGR